MEGLLHDLRHGLRVLGRRPGTTAIAVLTLALGTVANATVFGWIQSVLLDPMPGVENGQEIVGIQMTAASGPAPDTSYLDFLDLHDAEVFDGMTVFQSRALGLRTEDRVEKVWALLVSAGYFEMLGLRPAHGRFFSPAGLRELGAPAEVVLGFDFWQRRFGSDPSILGRTLELHNQRLEVVGIAPREFAGTVPGLRYDVWMPVSLVDAMDGREQLLTARHWRWMHHLARLQPGVGLPQAQKAVDRRMAYLQQTYPEDYRGLGAEVVPLEKLSFGAASVLGGTLKIMYGAVSLVLLIACANVANLLLAQAEHRRRELAVRHAAGAGPWRLLRQLLTENMLLALMGCGAAMLLMPWTLDILMIFAPVSALPVALAPRVDSMVVAFMLGLAALTAVFSGLPPALAAARAGITEALKSSGGAGRRSNRLGRALVVTQVALALVTLVGAGLFLRSFDEARRADVGFDRANVLLVQVELTSAGYGQHDGNVFYREALEKVEGLAQVASAAWASWVPLGLHGVSRQDIEVPGYQPAADESLSVWRAWTSPGYFETMRIALVGGRAFLPRDDAENARVAVVNEALARRYWPAGGVDQELRIGGVPHTVVGVVRDAKYRTLDEPTRPFLYLSSWQSFSPTLVLHVRTRTSPPEALLPVVEKTLESVGPSVPVFETAALDAYTKAALLSQSVAARLLSLLAALALLLSAVGLYGVVSLATNRRTREIGIRSALGADRRSVGLLILGEGAILSIAGVFLGLVLAFGLLPLAAHRLYEVSATDPLSFAAGVSIVCLVTLAACWIPARRAVRIPPIAALRED